MNSVEEVLSDDIGAVDIDGLELDAGQLKRIYEAMSTARALDARSAQLHADGTIGFYISSRGLEAVSVGAAFALEPADWLFPSHRDIGMYLTRGGSMKSWLDQLFGNASDLAKGRQIPGQHSLPDGRFVSVSGSVGSQVVQAAGCAMGIKSRRDDCCAVASFGEAAVAGADFHAAMNVAAKFRAPVVFLCRSAAREPGAEIGPPASVAEKARAYGVPAVQADGSDVLAVFKTVREARETAAKGGGPTLIEAVLHPATLMGGVEGRTERGARDPNTRLLEYLERCGDWDPAREEDFSGRLSDRLEAALEGARAGAAPAAEELFTDVCAALPWMLEEQRALALDGEDH